MTAYNPVMSWSMAEPGGRLLSILWAELIAQLPEVTLAQARNLCDAFLGFLDALLGFGPDETRSASLGAMQQFLMARLQGNIGAEDLCRHFHVSRSTVYRLFKPLGGVRQYINSARLGRCYAELRQADPKRVKVSDVATSWHFDEASSFARLFRKMFGAPPSQILGTSFQGTETPDVSGELPRANLIRDYMEWLRQASGSDPPPLPHRRLG
jgi:AraC-like DNA-binding protein